MDGCRILSHNFCASWLGVGGERLILSNSCEMYVNVLPLLILIGNLQLHDIFKFNGSSKHLSGVSREYSLSEIKHNFHKKL